jgi:peptide/nickel transport system permease protein
LIPGQAAPHSAQLIGKSYQILLNLSNFVGGFFCWQCWHLAVNSPFRKALLDPAVSRRAGIETSLFTLDGLRHLVLPGLTLATLPLAVIVRLVRTGVREQRRADYVRFGRAMGLSPWLLLGRYILRNVMVPVVTVMGLLFGTLVAFAVVTETVFAWPGSGKLIIDSIKQSDRPVVIAYLLFVVVMFMVINTVVDLLTALVDPRVRLQ